MQLKLEEVDFKPLDTFSKLNRHLGGLVVFAAFYLECCGTSMARKL
jgi:hypothetical protein